MEIDTVDLTPNEVEHRRTFEPIDLIVVDKIEPMGDQDAGEVTYSGWTTGVWPDWTLLQPDLRATMYGLRSPRRAYNLAAGSAVTR